MKADEIIESLEGLRSSIAGAATDGRKTLEESEYLEIRRMLREHPTLGPLLPGWLKHGSSHQDAVQRLKDEAGDRYGGLWESRRRVVRETIDSLISVLDGADPGAKETLGKQGIRLGGGGFGEVHRYRHPHLDIDFAVKTLQPAFSTGDEANAVARFFREARILFRLNHTNIVRVHDVGLLHRRPYIKMEMVDGQTLVEAMRQGLDAAEIRRVILGIARALRHAHKANVVHRDLKPSNIMLEHGTSRVVVLDFGMGVFLEDDIESRLTKTGQGSAAGHYTCPSLAADAKLLDARTDVYSLGAIWFELVFGRAPAGTGIETRIMSTDKISREEKALLLACLEPIDDRATAVIVVRKLTKLLKS